MTTTNDAGHPDQGGRLTTFDVRIWKVNTIAGKTRTTYQVRWKVAGRPKANTRNFATSRLAESRHAELLAATRRGEAFDVQTGIPVSELRAVAPAPEPKPELGRTWLEHARDFADLKWPQLAPTSRRSLAESLATVTPALLTGRPPVGVEDLLREALYGWIFQTGQRTHVGSNGERVENLPPAVLADAVGWLENHTRPVADLAEPEVARAALDRLATLLNGRPAGANTVGRKRAVFFGCLEYAVELKDLVANPLATLAWMAPKAAEQVDRRAVVNHKQARALLDVGVRPQVPELVAFFGSMYYAALRPGEVQEVHRNDLTLPESDGEWGSLTLAGNNPETSGRWADDGERSPRQLKHRPPKDTRPVPVAPPLVALYRWHLDEFGTTSDGRLFRGPAAGRCRAPGTERCGGRLADLRCHQRKWHRRLRPPPTTCGTPPCPHGSTRVSLRRRSRSGQGTPSRFCCTSTRSASSAKTKRHGCGLLPRWGSMRPARWRHDRVHVLCTDARRRSVPVGNNRERKAARGFRKVARPAATQQVLPGEAEGVGFEPTMRITPHSGFQDRRHRPLGEPSYLALRQTSELILQDPIIARPPPRRGAEAATGRRRGWDGARDSRSRPRR